MTSYSLHGLEQKTKKPKKPKKPKGEINTVPIYNDISVTIVSGTYLFEDVKRLKAEGERAKVDAVNNSIALLYRYVIKLFPGFMKCRGDISSEEEKFIEIENEKINTQLENGTRKQPPSREEWHRIVDDKINAIRQKRRTDIAPIRFRISKDGVHVGAIHMHQIGIVNTVNNITNLRTAATIALDIGVDNNHDLEVITAEIAVYMLKNPFLDSDDDPRTFQIVNYNLPDMYDGLRNQLNAPAIAVLDSEGLNYTTYNTNTPEQDALGIVRLYEVLNTRRGGK